ncbi:MAG: FAD:protein FMN transferase [Alphaproteobacteria bacterium]|nr:FAD:protein FMN transferase [Alphaproteobacteria bacterium]MBU6473003.1 FAD:protein FMN transferase [Alphaproteobacteria bacterium]MDE2011784.1 FAD:protein FMN transferase [Alphaproteobacteria bacterium]MDE2073814.1 FAD:protein FMN transferase [Alphaproteobacteria bacterium]MDE2351959.1 FAD:protein FMN transferase [Alphaproteobacteria bacterium]
MADTHRSGGSDRPASTLARSGADFRYAFHAMATPCEVRVETDDAALAEAAGRAAEAEARRIEQKFSRYREDSVVGRINASRGRAIELDAETAQLIDFAAQCFEMSGGLFDITSGVLRKIWRFDGSDNVPAPEQIKAIQPFVGWQKVTWETPMLTLPVGMEIDLGGLGKEYAVDRALAAVGAATREPALINFGGDLVVSGARKGGGRWKVAIESVDHAGQMAAMIELADGAIATSGDARRFLLKDGVRYCHILDPRSCTPVTGAPRSVTVAAKTCVEAGMFATLSMLQGPRAEAFLKEEGVRAWCIW